MTKFLLIPLFFLTVLLAAQDTVYQTIAKPQSSETCSFSTSSAASKPLPFPKQAVLEQEVPISPRIFLYGLQPSKSNLSFALCTVFPIVKSTNPLQESLIHSRDWLLFRQILI